MRLKVVQTSWRHHGMYPKDHPPRRAISFPNMMYFALLHKNHPKRVKIFRILWENIYGMLY